jgi:hypothetical protein
MKEEKAILKRDNSTEMKELFSKWLFYQKLKDNGENIKLHLKELKKPTTIKI